MSKDMSNIDIVQYEGGDYAKIMDNYNLHEITAAIANRAGKAAETIEEVKREVERLENNPDVVDIVATYADLQAYDTQGLTDKDVIRVLQDETHDGDSTYYRYDKQADTWTYIGESKQYTDFVGTDGTTAGTAGLVPAPATTDAGKFLKADGTWDDAGSTVNIVQITGTSTTDIMSQKATTGMVYNTETQVPKNNVQIGSNARSWNNSICIGANSDAGSNGYPGIAIGMGARTRGSNQISLGGNAGLNVGMSISNSISIGTSANASGNDSIAIGRGSNATQQGQFDVSTGANTTSGYNNSNYRLLTGLYDPQSAHDAANKEYVDPTTDSIAPTTATVGRLGQIHIDTTTDTAYMCVKADTVTPEYTWKQITA